MKIDNLLKFKNLSDQEKIKVAMVVVGVIVLIIILMSHYNNSSEAISEQQNFLQESSLQKQEAQANKGKEKSKKPAEIEALLQGVGRKNPFSPAVKNMGPANGEINLVGILWDAKKPLAVINDAIVGEGDMIKDKKVIKIHKNSVLLKENENEVILKVNK